MVSLPDPIISWTKTICPACKQETGPSSECYRIKTSTITISKDSVVNLFNESCTFRKNNMWEADINYPFSKSLSDKISAIDGINKIIPTEKYKFQIWISPVFDELEVKKNVTILYNVFAKELQLNKESNKLNEKISIKLPNGYIYDFISLNENDSSINISSIDEILSGIFGSEIVKKT